MRRYPAKLLLFGEHVLLLGAPALSMPVPAFGGQWDWRSPDTPMTEQDMRLLEFARSAALRNVPDLDAKAFEADLGLGLFFHSDIPTGYGLGSSGALCAAIYDRYTQQKSKDPAELKAIFAAMESYFHGNSSGLDPLTSYLNQPLIVRNKTELSVADCRPWRPAEPVVFLVDSQMPRQTGPMVRWFQHRCGAPDFRKRLNERYLPKVEEAIANWQSGDLEAFMLTISELSRFQHQELGPIIPTSVKDLWHHSFDTKTVRFKLCGAGGGGYLLGFARSHEAAREAAQHHPLVFPFDHKLTPA